MSITTLNIPAWQRILPMVDGRNVYTMSKKTPMQYSHFIEVLHLLEQKKLVVSEKKGRERLYNLTEAGQTLAFYCTKMVVK